MHRLAEYQMHCATDALPAAIRGSSNVVLILSQLMQPLSQLFCLRLFLSLLSACPSLSLSFFLFIFKNLIYLYISFSPSDRETPSHSILFRPRTPSVKKPYICHLRKIDVDPALCHYIFLTIQLHVCARDLVKYSFTHTHNLILPYLPWYDIHIREIIQISSPVFDSD